MARECVDKADYAVLSTKSAGQTRGVRLWRCRCAISNHHVALGSKNQGTRTNFLGKLMTERPGLFCLTSLFGGLKGGSAEWLRPLCSILDERACLLKPWVPSSVSITKTNKRPASFSRAFRHSLRFAFFCSSAGKMRARPAAARKETIWPDGTTCFCSVRVGVRLQICSCHGSHKGAGKWLYFWPRTIKCSRLFIWRAQLLRFIQLFPLRCCARNCIFLGINSLNILQLSLSSWPAATLSTLNTSAGELKLVCRFYCRLLDGHHRAIEMSPRWRIKKLAEIKINGDICNCFIKAAVQRFFWP